MIFVMIPGQILAGILFTALGVFPDNNRAKI